ncbi:MAG TPA: hypothetical protein VH165_08625 [Kofleriaceae bacterium]|nr:hypothetical protein [Kofleriaceae bacterium]
MGCASAGRAPIAPAAAPPAPIAAAPPDAPRAPDPDLHHPPPRHVLDLDWSKITLTDEADAITLWHRIAPTGADWEDKIEEIPAALARPLAVAVVRGGNFACGTAPSGACAKPLYDVPAPAETATFDDPCLRRLLALWALAQLEDDDVPAVHPALLAIAALPPPESQLVASAIHAIPEASYDARLEILAIAWRAGQHDVVESAIGKLDDPHLVDAVRHHHIASALELLAVTDHRAIYLGAVTDEALATRARIQAIAELTGDDKLAADIQAALVTAARSKDCQVAASAARVLDQHGDHRFVPRKPRTSSIPAVMRSMCVLASYEALQRTDEPSLLASYLPARGLERVTVTYDALSEVDPDGDGDPHTTHSAELVARGEAVLPEIEELVHAMQHCAGTVCSSDDRDFRFVWARADSIDSGPQRSKDQNHPTARAPLAGTRVAGELVLTRLELADRPPCAEPNHAHP